MSIEHEELDENLLKISLVGRLDIEGSEKISSKFKLLIDEANKNVLVDLTAVSFLASMGIRELITNAKLLQKSGWQMFLIVGENELIYKVLETTNIHKLLPMYKDAIDAEKAARAWRI